jgi:hypothetical protein
MPLIPEKKLLVAGTPNQSTNRCELLDALLAMAIAMAGK